MILNKKIIFTLIYVIFIVLISQNYSKLNSDITTFLNLDKDSIISSFDNRNFSILIKYADDVNTVKNIIEKSGILDHSNDFDITSVEKYKLAIMSKDDISLLQNNPILYFENSIKSFLSPVKILNNDFFSMVKNLNFALTYDLNTKSLKTKNFYLLNYKLNQNFTDDKLINLVYTLKKIDQIYINSPMFYSSYAKHTAIFESTILGSISLFASIVFVILAFSNLHIFKIFFVIIFGLTSGLAASLTILSSVNYLTIVISTSLIGLMIDYMICFLSLNMGIAISKQSPRNILSLFLTALVVTISGYLIFLFSPMKFLHEIAIFSVFSLLGAFLITYFLLPEMLEGKIFKSYKIFDCFINWLINLAKFCVKYRLYFIFAYIFLLIFGFYKISNLPFVDNIKSYVSIPKIVKNDGEIFAKEVQGIKSKFIEVNEKNSSNLVKELDDLIKNPFYISSFFNDEKTQENIKNMFKKFASNNDILILYKNIGINNVEQKFTEIYSLKTYKSSEICEKLFHERCSLFFNQNNEKIFIDSASENSKFYEILNKYDATYIDYVKNINLTFTDIKKNAIELKIVGFIVAFMILWTLINFKTAFFTIINVFACSIFSIAIYAIFGLNIDIFAIFGVILGSAVGIDYMLFALNGKFELRNRIFAIIVASFTSIISFFTLMFSSTYAVFSFGFGVSLIILVSSFMALIYSLRLKIN